MGWRAAYRSYNAATRANQRTGERYERIISKHDASVDRISSGFDEETIKDLKRIEDFEDKLAEKPISFGKLSYDPADKRWSFRELRDDTGKLTFSLTATVRDSPMTFEPSAIDLPDRRVEIVAAAFSRHGILIAVAITPRPDAKKVLKLIYKTTPAKNRILLEGADGIQALPVESDIDDPVLLPSRNLRMVVFPWDTDEPITGPWKLNFLVDGSPSIAIGHANPAELVAAMAAERTLVDQMTEKYREMVGSLKHKAEAQKHHVRREVNAAKQRSQSGCLIALSAIMVLGVAVCVGFARLLA